MKKQLILVAVVGFPLVVVGEEAIAQGANSGIICDAIGIPTTFTTTSTIVVTGVANQHVNVCGWMATGTGTLQIGWSTAAAACTTTVTTLTFSMDLSAAAPLQKSNPYAVLSAPAGASLCGIPSATAVKYMIFFSQD